jgi:hypothetical protein
MIKSQQQFFSAGIWWPARIHRQPRIQSEQSEIIGTQKADANPETLRTATRERQPQMAHLPAHNVSPLMLLGCVVYALALLLLYTLVASILESSRDPMKSPAISQNNQKTSELRKQTPTLKLSEQQPWNASRKLCA